MQERTKPIPNRGIGDPSLLTPLPTALRPLPEDDDQLIRRPDMPLYLPVKEQTLARWAVEGSGPPFIKCGRQVAYRVRDLRAWLEERTRQHTAQK